MKYTLTLSQNFPFAQNPSFCEIDGEKIICNDVTLPRAIDADAGINPHNVRLWVIGTWLGPVCAIWASCCQDALDAAVDANMMDCFMAENQDYDDPDLTALGNASELFDLSDVWMGEVVFDPARDIQLIVALARASESGKDTL